MLDTLGSVLLSSGDFIVSGDLPTLFSEGAMVYLVPVTISSLGLSLVGCTGYLTFASNGNFELSGACLDVGARRYFGNECGIFFRFNGFAR